jgi:hypothetical protein
VRNFFRLDPAKTLKVHELLTACGWLPPAGDKGGERV